MDYPHIAVYLVVDKSIATIVTWS
uniref:Uncharacterized protein n=1 Tax=Arundo donax TaxID=35708 RepID=A0A0A9FLU9_ARUDO